MAHPPDRAEKLAEELAGVLAGDLVSILLYGSAARDDFHEESSDLNVLVLLRSVDEAHLRACSDLARAWVDEGNSPPMFLGEDELARSLDIFPIEYSEIRDAHRVLFGSDPFATLQIQREHLRLQCERELKIALIQLRERYLLAADDAGRIGELLRRSISTFLVHMRTLLRIEGVEVPPRSEAVVAGVARRVGFAPEPFLEVLQARRSNARFEAVAGDTLVVGYIAAAARIVAYADGLENATR
jgi:predicted nucleotidyltransferase